MRTLVRFPDSEQFAWLVVLLRHFDQLAPLTLDDLESEAWHGTPPFEHDFWYITNRLEDTVKLWASEDSSNLATLSRVEEIFASDVGELQKQFEPAKHICFVCMCGGDTAHRERLNL